MNKNPSHYVLKGTTTMATKLVKFNLGYGEKSVDLIANADKVPSLVKAVDGIATVNCSSKGFADDLQTVVKIIKPHVNDNSVIRIERETETTGDDGNTESNRYVYENTYAYFVALSKLQHRTPVVTSRRGRGKSSKEDDFSIL
jgi:hypothetical protein